VRQSLRGGGDARDQRDPEKRIRQAIGHHADDDDISTIDPQRAADHLWVAGEATAPEFRAEDGDAVATGLLFLSREGAAECGWTPSVAKRSGEAVTPGCVGGWPGSARL